MSNLQDSSAILNKARHRWRLAYTAIYSFRILVSVLTQVVTKKNTINTPNRRWRVAFAAIYSSRAIACLYNEVVAKKHNNPSSFVAIHVEPDLFFPNVNMICITKLVKDKDRDTLLQLGGIDGLLRSLQTDERKGINGSREDISRRRKAFGCNSYHKLTTKSFCHFVLIAMKDPILIILLVCAILALGYNIKENGLIHGWYDGGSILIAVLVVVTVCSMSHFWPYRKFNKLLQMSKENHIEVVRNGQQQLVLVSNIVVGDVVCLRSGNQIPADGFLLSSHSSLLVDESSLGADTHHVEVSKVLNPFLFSGTKVNYGHGRMLVTSVGENTKRSEIMSLLGHEPHKWKSLESRLIALTRIMGIVGSIVAVSTLIVLLVRYFDGYMKKNDGDIIFVAGKTRYSDAWRGVVGILVSTVAVATSAIPEGLPLAVAITVAYTMKRMIKNQALFRQFSTCVQLASTSVICIDTNEVLTLMKQKKFKLWLGEELMEGSSSSQLIASNVRYLLCQGIGFSKSQLLDEFSQNSIEEAIISWATTELGMDAQELREGLSVLHVETQSEEMKHSKIVIRNEFDYTVHVHLNGKAEGILSKCSYYYGVEGIAKAMDNNTRRRVEHTVQVMEQEGFKCIAFAHKVLKNENHEIGESSQWLEDDTLILLALICLKDPIQPGIPKAVEDCKKAGVNIKLITSEDVLTATAIASECGILLPNEEFNNGEVMEALEFRNYTETERLEKVDQVCVMAKATSSDKLLLVQCLKQKGHVVTVTGNSTGDAPALKEADVAIHTGFQGNSIAVENSDIIVLNKGLVSVFAVIQVWRGIYDNIKVFIQFLLAANLASLVTDFVSTVSADHPPTIDILAGISVKDIPYAVLQILWVKLIIGTLAVLALVVEQNTKEFMQEQPARPDQPLISNNICKNILIHASYEIAILLTFQFKGERLLGINGDLKDTLVFNLVVLFQVFAVLKARKPDGNIFKGTQRRKLFWGIIFGIVFLQVVMLEILAKVTATGALNLWQWGASIGIAFTSWPIHYIGNKFILVPEEPFMCSVL